MRKILAALLTVAACGSLAGVASADAPHRNYNTGGYSLPAGPGAPQYVHYGWGCETYASPGVLGQYGAWGFYIDGCTSSPVSCPAASYRGCVVTGTSKIFLTNVRGDQVTMNSRVRVFNSAGQILRWYDRSCAGNNSCVNTQPVTLNPGEQATVQCNGVRANVGYNTGLDNCYGDLVSNR